MSPDQKLLTLAMYCVYMTSHSRGIAEREQHIQLQKLAEQWFLGTPPAGL
jgi:hypothetical protein